MSEWNGGINPTLYKDDYRIWLKNLKEKVRLVQIKVDTGGLIKTIVDWGNEYVKSNIERFPESIRFQVNKRDRKILKSQIVMSNYGRILKSL